MEFEQVYPAPMNWQSSATPSLYSKPGGMMRFGVPYVLLSANVRDSEMEIIKRTGAKIKTNSSVESVQSQFDQGYESVFMGAVCMKGQGLRIEGADLDSILTTGSFISNGPRGYCRTLFSLGVMLRFLIKIELKEGIPT